MGGGGGGYGCNATSFFCESNPGHFLKLSCLRTANKCIGQGIFSIHTIKYCISMK